MFYCIQEQMNMMNLNMINVTVDHFLREKQLRTIISIRIIKPRLMFSFFSEMISKLNITEREREREREREQTQTTLTKDNLAITVTINTLKQQTWFY